MRLHRRGALALLGLGAAGAAKAQTTYTGAVSFRHGVASGDPLQDRVVLWTRLTPAAPTAQPIVYGWSLNPVDRRAGGAKSGKGQTGPDRDYTVKIDVDGLEPGRAYTFEFTVGGVRSPLGRTRTLPAGPVQDVVLAVASCALYPNGHFNAYGAIAALSRVDAVVHLGDYIYEYGGPGSYGMDSAVAAERPHDPPHEIVTLADYRRRHAQYKSDPQLQAAHARAPWITVWDDHETANDSWSGGAQNHQPDKEGDWATRKAAALKAYFEWMPIRDPDGPMAEAINRSVAFGDLASLIMLETRLTGRDRPLDYAADLPVVDNKPDVAAFRRKLDDPARRMMNAEQEAWLSRELSHSVEAGHVWQVLGNEVVMGRLMAPSPSKVLGEARLAQVSAGLDDAAKGRLKRLEELAAMGLPYGLDMWDGYPADRERVYAAFKQTKARPIVLAGDSHAFWANDLVDASGAPVAVEFGTTSITSPGGGDVVTDFPVSELFAGANPDTVFCDMSAKGFLLLTLTRTEAKAEMIAVSSIVAKAYTPKVLKTFRTRARPQGLSKLEAV